MLTECTIVLYRDNITKLFRSFSKTTCEQHVLLSCIEARLLITTEILEKRHVNSILRKGLLLFNFEDFEDGL